MPNFYEFSGDQTKGIFLKSGMQIAHNFQRVVHGERGAYVEFLPEQIIHENIFIPEDKRWKLRYDEVYYIEHRTNDGTFVLVYEQKREVDYADYVSGLFYITPSKLEGFTITDRY